MTFIERYNTIKVMHYLLKDWKSQREIKEYLKRHHDIVISPKTFGRYLSDLVEVFGCSIEYNPATVKYRIKV